jgi:hypothetical protein
MTYLDKRHEVKKLIDLIGADLFSEPVLAQLTEHQLDMIITLGVNILGETEENIKQQYV